MRKIALISIGLLLLTATVLGFASAETETTYYMYENGEWRECNGEEAIVAEEAMKHDKPLSISREGLISLLGSHAPFWNYNVLRSTDDDAVTPVPTPTITPTPTQTPAPERVRDLTFGNRVPKGDSLPSRWLNRIR